MKDPNQQLLLDLHLGLAAVLDTLVMSLRHSGHIDTANLRLLLEANAELLAQNKDQRLPFELALQTLAAPRWQPQLIQGGLAAADQNADAPEPDAVNHEDVQE
jgi:hypothetical protein